MTIDRLLLMIFRETLHRWGSDNKAKARAYASAVVVPVVMVLLDRYVPAELHDQIITVLGSGGLVALGNSIHKNVSPYEGPDA